MDLHTVYPTVCKNSEGKSWRDRLRSAILKLSTILKPATRDSMVDFKYDPITLSNFAFVLENVYNFQNSCHTDTDTEQIT